MKKIISSVKRKIYYRQHPEAAIRYSPIVALIKTNGWQTKKILEVGSGSYGIAPYLKKPVTGLDMDFSEPKYNLLKQVSGKGEHLPFTDNSFDITILSDVLEHIPSKIRNKVITEAIRVSKLGVIISGPFGAKAFAQDKRLSKVIDHHFIKEHLKFRLPHESDIKNFVDKKVLSVDKIGNFFNLGIRYFVMRLWASKNKIFYYTYLKGLMPLTPLLSRCNWPPTYRTIFLLRLRP